MPSPRALAPSPRLLAPSPHRSPCVPTASPPRSIVARARSASGQASIEFLATLPIALLLLAFASQAVVAGQALWNVRVAARAAARAHSLGADAERAARTHLPSRLERGLRVTTPEPGRVRVSVRVPSVLPSLRLGRVDADSHFRPQT